MPCQHEPRLVTECRERSARPKPCAGRPGSAPAIWLRTPSRRRSRPWPTSRSQTSGARRLVELGDGRLRQQELAQLLGWERSRLSRQISRMADRRLVIRERSGSARLISATEHGRAAVTAARPAHAVAVRRVLLDQIAPSPQPISGTRSRRSALTTIPAPTTATDHQSRRRSASLRAVGHLADPEPRRARPSHCDRGARGALGRKAGVGAFGRVALLAAELQGGRRGGADRSDMYASRRRRGPTARLIWAPAQALRGPR